MQTQNAAIEIRLYYSFLYNHGDYIIPGKKYRFITFDDAKTNVICLQLQSLGVITAMHSNWMYGNNV